MAKKNRSVPQYGTVTRKGILYYRTRIQDADGKQVSLYATTCEELYEKQLAAKKQVEEILFRRKHPTVAEYCEKWLLMQSAKVSSATMKGYTSDMRNYIIKPLGDMYMEEVTADDIRLALVPLTKKSEGLCPAIPSSDPGQFAPIFPCSSKKQIRVHLPELRQLPAPSFPQSYPPTAQNTDDRPADQRYQTVSPAGQPDGG